MVAIGDAHTCTNPLYGRGCSLGIVHAELLADAVAAHDTFDEAFHLDFEAATAREIEPWYKASVTQDRAQRAEAHRLLLESRGEAPEVDESDPDEVQRQFMRSVLREGLLPALRTDATVFRAFLRGFNLLSSPDALMEDTEVMAKVFEAYQSRDEREPEPPLGPDRAELQADRHRRRLDPTPPRRTWLLVPRWGAVRLRTHARASPASTRSRFGEQRAERPGAAYPPATGMMLTVSPSGTEVLRPSRKRTSSSATKTFTKRRRPPSSSRRRSAKPGWADSRLVKTSPTVAPSTATSDAPPVRVRRVVGTRTVTLIAAAPGWGWDRRS